MTKHSIAKKLIVYPVIAFGLLLFLIVGDEVFDFPHALSNAPSTPINWNEAVIEGGYVLVLAVFSLYLSLLLLNRVQYREGFWAICSFCKKIHVGQDGKQIEDYISAHSAAELSMDSVLIVLKNIIVFFRKRRFEGKNYAFLPMLILQQKICHEHSE
jgi:hypothetical protein